MKLWMALYAMIWIVFLEFLLAMTPGASVGVMYAHLVLGFGILGLAYYNFTNLRRTRVPGRVKRTAQATYTLSIAMVGLGFLLVFRVGIDWVIPLLNVSIYGLILLFHVVNAIAIITQAAAVAIAYDMWEDREFEKETEPGEIPERPVPAPPTVDAPG